MQRCPMCGYSEPVEGKKVTTTMQHYVRLDDPKVVAIFNSDDTILKTKENDKSPEVTWIEVNEYNRNKDKDGKYSPKPVTPPATGDKK